MAVQRSGISAVISRAAAFSVAMLAVLTLVASGGLHELLHADDARGAPFTAASLLTDDGGAAPAAPADIPSHKNLPPHGCSGHCTAHAASPAPILVALPAPLLMHASWRIERGLALRQHDSSGLDRPPRA